MMVLVTRKPPRWVYENVKMATVGCIIYAALDRCYGPYAVNVLAGVSWIHLHDQFEQYYRYDGTESREFWGLVWQPETFVDNKRGIAHNDYNLNALETIVFVYFLEQWINTLFVSFDKHSKGFCEQDAAPC